MITLVCEDHDEQVRWVADSIGATFCVERVSYHFRSQELNCPTCGRPGLIQVPAGAEPNAA